MTNDAMASEVLVRLVALSNTVKPNATPASVIAARVCSR